MPRRRSALRRRTGLLVRIGMMVKGGRREGWIGRCGGGGCEVWDRGKLILQGFRGFGVLERGIMAGKRWWIFDIPTS